MVKVIKSGNIKTTECVHCGAILSYDVNEDVKKEIDYEDVWSVADAYYYLKCNHYLLCPECGEYNLVRQSTEKRPCR